MPADKRPLKVLLCHAHRDRVHALYDRLTKDGVDVWLTRRGIENPRLSAWKPCGLTAQSPKDFHELSRDFNPAHCHPRADRDRVYALYPRP